MIYLLYAVPIVLVLMLIVYFCMGSSENSKNNSKKKLKEETNNNNNLLTKLFNKPETKTKKYDSWNEIGNVFLKYVNKIDGEDYYLTWKYSGADLKDKNMYSLILLSYKNKQNEFRIHLKDHLYLKPFYQKYGFYNDNDFMKGQLDNLIFATSDYNTNKEDFLELEHFDETTYIIKANVFANRGSFKFVHIDDKNKLYFDQGINENIAKFVIA